MSSPYGKKYLSPSRVDSDHKDIVISQLKAEAFELKEGERDYNDLSSRVNNLNHRYNLLKEEMALDEKEHIGRNEQSTKTINILRAEIDTLRSELSSIEADIQDLRADNENINGIVSARSGEVAKLKSDLADLVADNDTIVVHKKELERQIAKLQAENEEDSKEGEDLSDKIAQATEEKTKNERLIRELENEVESLLKTNDGLKAQQDDVKFAIREKVNAIKNSEQAHSENRKRIIALESRVNDRKRANEKLNNEIAASQKEQEQQASKGEQATEKVHELDGRIQERNEEVEELRRQCEALRKEHAELYRNNDDLANDIKVSNRHLDLLAVQNMELLEEVERVNEEDEAIRRILERGERINNVTSKYQDRMRASATKMNSSLVSPLKSTKSHSREVEDN